MLLIRTLRIEATLELAKALQDDSLTEHRKEIFESIRGHFIAVHFFFCLLLIAAIEKAKLVRFGDVSLEWHFNLPHMDFSHIPRTRRPP